MPPPGCAPAINFATLSLTQREFMNLSNCAINNWQPFDRDLVLGFNVKLGLLLEIATA